MAEVIKFEATAQVYEELADEKLDENDYESALVYFLAALKKSRSKLALFIDVADVYFSMELYELAADYWFKVLSVAPRWELPEAYNGLGACYYNLENLTVASHYFNKQIIDGPGEFFFSEEFEGTIREIVSKEDGYKVVYPPEECDYSEAMKKGKAAMLGGRFGEAIETYSQIPPESKTYDEAQLEMSIACFLIGNTDEAIAINRTVYERDNHNVYALCNLSTMYRFKNMSALAETYFSYVDERDIKNDDELYKVATTCCEGGKHSRALGYFEQLLKRRPYNLSLIFFYGVALYNCGEFYAAREQFGRLMRITDRNPVALYYYRLADRRLEEKAKTAAPLAYYYRLPEEEERANLKKLAALLKIRMLKNIRKKLRERETAELIDWCFSYSDVQVQRGAMYFLVSAETRAADAYILDRFIDPSVYDEAKEYAISLLVERNFTRTVGLVVSNVFEKLSFYALNLNDERYGPEFTGAYAICFAKIAVTRDRFDMRRVYDAANDIFYNNADKSVFKSANERALAAYIYIAAGVEKAYSVSSVAVMFNCGAEEIKELAKVLT